MSRIGKQPIPVIAGVEVTIDEKSIKVKGPKGMLTQSLHPHVRVVVEAGNIMVTVLDPKNPQDHALWGLFQRLLSNMVTGTTQGFEKQLEVNGVGYKIASAGNKLTLNLGFSHPIDFALPQGIDAKVDKNIITLMGIDKQQVGEVAAQIRRLRKPEPYKGKGIKYVGEVIRRKAGKAAKAAGKK